MSKKSKFSVFERILSWILSMLMICGLFVVVPITVNAQTNGHTKEEAVAWARAQIGKYLDYDGAYGCQCVDLIAYYYKYLGNTTPGGNGCDYSSNSLPSGWTRIQNTPTFVPEPGDIVVWTNGGWKNGHVAIFLSGDTHSFNSIDQNWPQGSAVKEVYHSNYNYVWGVIRPDFQEAHNPIGYFDGVESTAPGKLHIAGWAFDYDNVNAALDIHVYVGGTPGTGAPCYVISANKYRPDVNGTFPGIGEYHGFDDTITVDRTGNQEIHVYAINVGGGNDNPELDQSPRTVNIQSDTERPKVSNPVVSEVSESGYRFTCTISDNIGVTSVKFPTWSGTNWQDDVVWHIASISGNKATAYIKSSDHNGDTGSYYTDIYAYDAAGNVSHDSGSPRTIIPQLKPYIIKYNLNGGSGSFPEQKKYYNGTAIKLHSESPTKTGYTFVCWNTKADGTGTNYSPNTSYSANSDLQLYAVWKANTYTIAYNANGGSGTMSSSSVTFEQKFTLADCAYKKEGYSFTGYNVCRKSDNKWYISGEGWFTETEIKNSNYSKKIYGAKSTWNFDNSWFSSNTGSDTYTFYAVWTPAKPSATTVSVVAGNTSTPTAFSWIKSTNANTYNLKIWKDKLWEGDAFVIKYGLSDLSCYLDLPAGYYEAYVDSINDYGWTTSNVVQFTVDEIIPKAKGTYNGHTYEYYDQSLTWNQAYKFCERKGGHLVTITSKEENDFVVDLAKDRSGSLWAGGKTFDAKTWYWINSEPFDYQNWDTGEPNNFDNAQDTLQIYVSGKWDDLYANMYNPQVFVCEYDNEIDTSKYTPVYKEYYNGHEYWFFEDNVDWQTAKKICEEKGGYLTIPNSAEENAFILSGIKKTSQKETWIGVTDIVQEGVWKDVKGNDITYTNWASSQPDNYLGIEDYVHFYEDGTWNDLRSFSAFGRYMGFVCEFDSSCITYNLNGGTSEEIASQIKIHDQAVTLSSVIPIRKGYTFLGWSEDKNSKTAHYQPNELYTGNSDVTLYAVWKVNTKIALNKTSLELDIGTNATLKAILTPENDNMTVNWKSSNTNIATVDKNGMVTSVNKGTATITATLSNGEKATCTVTVKKYPESISVNKTSVTLGVGQTCALKTDVTPVDAYTTYSWSSTEKTVATVNSNGKITAKKVGTATIKVKTINGQVATCKVTVKPAPESVALNKTSVIMGVKQTCNLTATLTPNNSVTYCTWTSSDKTIATVTSTGKVTAKKVGKVTITVKTSNGKTANCVITVKKAPDSIALNKTSATLGVKQTCNLTVALSPDNSATYCSWSSSDKTIATVTSTGKVTAKKVGTVTIMVKASNGKTATCIITVKKAPTDIALNKTATTIKVGQTETLKATLTPSNSVTYCNWSSSDKTIATVNANGVVTAKKAGAVTIMVKTSNGKVAVCTVTVKK